MDLFVLDDAVRKTPERPGMGPLFAVGGLHVPSDSVGHLEHSLDTLCLEVGFPPHEEFKWSPGRELWMHRALVGAPREHFFLSALSLAAETGCSALVVIADESRRRAIPSSSSIEEDVVTMFLERAQNHLHFETGTEALVLTDRPSGDRKSEVEFLTRCLATMRDGTSYVLPDRLTLAIATQSRLVRALQLADVVVSSTLAFVGGEDRYSPSIFAGVRPMLRGGGGIGLKIHPDGRYANLYRWLLDEEFLMRQGRYVELPDPHRAYAHGPDEP